MFNGSPQILRTTTRGGCGGRGMWHALEGNVYRISHGKPEGRRPFGITKRGIILKCVLREFDGKA
jgi:hypothetical protein